MEKKSKMITQKTKVLNGKVVVNEQTLEIMQMIANGFTRKELTDKFFMTKRMLDSRVDALRETFECSTTASLVATLIRKGYIK